MSDIDKLPENIWVYIFSFFNKREHGRASIVNKRLNKISQHKSLQNLPWPAINFAEEPAVKQLSGHTENINALIKLPSGLIVTGSSDKSIRVWDMKKNVCVYTFYESDGYQQYRYPIRGLAALPKDRWVSGSQRGICLWYDLHGNQDRGVCSFVLGKEHGGLDSSDTAYATGFLRLSNGWLVSTSGTNANIYLWNINRFWDNDWDPTNEKLYIKTLQSPAEGRIRALAELPDGRLVTGPCDPFSSGNLVIWDVKQEKSEIWQGHNGTIFALLVLPNGQLVSGGGGDNSIRVWEATQSGKCSQVLKAHKHYVSAFALLPSGEFVSGSLDGEIKIWKIENWTCVKTLKASGPVYGFTVLPKGQLVSASGKDLQVWEFPELKFEAQDTQTPSLTPMR